MAKECPVCTAENVDEATFCTTCGVGFVDHDGHAPPPPPHAPSGPSVGMPGWEPPKTPAVPVGPPHYSGGFVSELKALPTWTWVAAGVVILVLFVVAVAMAVGGGGGSESPGSTLEQRPTAPGPTAPMSTTSGVEATTAPPTTAVSPADLYIELQTEIDRACERAVITGNPPEVEFRDRWSGISSEEKLLAATQQCVDIRTGN